MPAHPPPSEYFGVAFYVGATILTLVYVLWAFTPAAWLHYLNIYYYPSRWWAVAVPAYVLVCIIYTYLAIVGYNTEVLEYPPDRLETLTDTFAKVTQRKEFYFQPSDAVYDLSLAGACEVLYGRDSDSDDSNDDDDVDD